MGEGLINAPSHRLGYESAHFLRNSGTMTLLLVEPCSCGSETGRWFRDGCLSSQAQIGSGTLRKNLPDCSVILLFLNGNVGRSQRNILMNLRSGGLPQGQSGRRCHGGGEVLTWFQPAICCLSNCLVRARCLLPASFSAADEEEVAVEALVLIAYLVLDLPLDLEDLDRLDGECYNRPF